MVKHFRFLYDLQTLIPESEMAAIFSGARPGTLLQMLHSQLHEEPEAQYDMYEKFIERSKVSVWYIHNSYKNYVPTNNVEYKYSL